MTHTHTVYRALTLVLASYGFCVTGWCLLKNEEACNSVLYS